MSAEAAVYLAALAARSGLFDELTPNELIAAAYCDDLWLRPNQTVIPGRWRSWGWVAGRGFGKSSGIARYTNRAVETGTALSVALAGPTVERAQEVQVAALIENSAPWFRPEPYKQGVRWPNGVIADTFSSENEHARGGNYELTWACELVEWQASTRIAAWDALTSATRSTSGRWSRYLWDTTSKGRNDLILRCLADHRRDPEAHRMTRGAMFDNPLLSPEYIAAECEKYAGRRYGEEILGLIYEGSAGALWEQLWLDRTRVAEPPPLEIVTIAIDSALSDDKSADDTGISVAGRSHAKHVYALEDLTAKLKPDAWGDVAINACIRHRASGVVAERGRSGDHVEQTIRSRATNANLTVRTLKRDEPFPRYTPGVVYFKDYPAVADKLARAGAPASETEAGRVHLVGNFPELEGELTTYDGDGRSPNRFDAFVYNVIELRELWREGSTGSADIKQAQTVHKKLQAADLKPRTVREILRGRTRGRVY